MATTRQPRQFLAVWNDAGTEVKGSTFEESLFVDGAFWKNELTSIAPESFGQFGTMFSNQLQIQHDALVAEKTTLLLEKETLEADKTTLESTKATLETQLAEKTEQVKTLTEDKAMLAEQLAAANARIASLLQEIPFNPREASVNSFKARLFQVLETEDIVRLYANETDPILQKIAKTIENWDHRYPIRLDSQELQQPLGYLVSIDLLTPEEVVFLRQDCTRDEAYFAS